MREQNKNPSHPHAPRLTERTPRALSVYVHWPFCKSKCPYCDFNSHVREGVDQARWRQALLAELGHQAELIGHNFEISSIFFGGGTPSLMPPETVAAVIEGIGARWPLAQEVEITLEANPTSSEMGRFSALRQAGVNRLSVGVQSLRAEALAFLGREHSAQEALRALEMAAAVFPRYSFDLIYALPGQNSAAWEAELREALGHARGHLSLYQLTLEPDTPFSHWHAAREFTLPDEETAAEMYERTAEICAEYGVFAYEISNYAAPGMECLHNVACWRGQPYLGIGPGAHGRLPTGEGWRATATLKSPERWLGAVERRGHGLETDEPMEPRERAEELLLSGLRLRMGIDRAQFERSAGQAFEDTVNPVALQRMVSLGLLEASAACVRVSPMGFLLLDGILAQLLTGAPERL